MSATPFGHFFVAQTLMWSRAGQRRIEAARTLLAAGAATGAPEQVVDVWAELLHSVVALHQAIRAVEGRRNASISGIVGIPPPGGVNWENLKARVKSIRDAVTHEDERILSAYHINLDGDDIVCRSARPGGGVKETRISLPEISNVLGAIRQWGELESTT